MGGGRRRVCGTGAVICQVIGVMVSFPGRLAALQGFHRVKRVIAEDGLGVRVLTL